LLIAPLLLCAAAGTLHAQVSTADIVGTVTDSSQAVMAGVMVTVTNLATGLTYKGVSNTRGDYSIPLLPPGQYRIQAELAGFKTWSVPGITLSVGDRFRADAKMEVGGVEQTVQVTAETAALQTETATVNSIVDQTQVQNLPINGRNFIQLAQIVPGANNFTGGSFANGGLDDRRRTTTVSVNGRTGAENNFIIDGMDNNEKFIGSILVKPSMEALGEMKVLTNTFSAELARTSGGAISIITKGGTNEFHGSAFEYLRNEALDARPPNLTANAATPPYKQHNFGGSLGGPIKKNRTFFFGSWETYKVALGAPQLATVPTLPMRQGDFSALLPNTRIFDVNNTTTANGVTTRAPFAGNIIPPDRINPVSLKIVNLYPDPINNSANNNYQRNGSRDQTDNTLDTRVDHRFSDRNSIFGRYSYAHVNTQLPVVFPGKNGFEPVGGTVVGQGGQGGFTRQSVQGIALVDTYTLSPNAVIIVRGGFSRYALSSLPQGSGTTPATKLGIPNVNVDDDSSGFPSVTASNFTGMGESNFLPTFNFQNVFTTSATLQYIRGSHNFRVGGEFIRRQVNEHQSSDPRITFNFTPTFTADSGANFSGGNSIASLLLGFPQSTTRNRLLAQPGYRFLEDGLYLQDDWRVNRWLTLNLGVRYDYSSPLSESGNRIANFDFSTNKLVFPNQDGIDNVVGVRKDFNNISPRFGFAAQLGRNTVIRGGFGINYTPLLQGTPNSFRNPPQISTLAITPTNLTPINSMSDLIPPLTPIPVTNLSGPLLAVDRNYKVPYVEQFNFTIQRQLPWGLMLNNSIVGSLGRAQSGSNLGIDRNGAAPGAANVQTRRVLSAIYPNVTTINTVTNFYTSSYYALQTSLDMRARKGITMNINHTWGHTIDSAEIRYLAFATPVAIKGNAGGTTGADIRNHISVSLNYNVPLGKNSKSFYAVLLKNWRINSLGFAQSGVPFSITQTGTQTNNATGINRPNQIADYHVANPTMAEWFNPAAFAPQPANTWGDHGRNMLNAPGTWNFDLSLHREFLIRERMKLQFRWEAFDFTNSVTPNQPVAVLGQPGFGSILTVNGNRQQQVALKLLF
jgi:outer membrane receptor protein involved in Fe transport